MIGHILLTLFLLLPTAAQASDSAFQEAFRAYVEVKSLEQELALLPFRQNLEPEKKENDHKKLSAALTQRRIEFQNFLRSPGASPLEQILFNNLQEKGKKMPIPQKIGLDYLSQRFPAGKKLSAMEWQVIRDWFGNPTQESFLKVHFEMAKISGPQKPGAMPSGLRMVHLVDPYKRFREKNPLAFKKAANKNDTADYLELSAFNKIDDQANEVYRLLRDNYAEPLVIITSGESSAIFFRALDLHPDLRQSKWIKAWVNADGRLYGISPAKDAERRSPASVKKHNPTEALERETLGELYRLQSETKLRPMPVGKGFPIYNIVSFDEKFRAAQNLGESVVFEGQSFYVEKGSAMNVVQEILSQFDENTPASEFRDSPGARDISI